MVATPVKDVIVYACVNWKSVQHRRMSSREVGFLLSGEIQSVKAKVCTNKTPRPILSLAAESN